MNNAHALVSVRSEQTTLKTLIKLPDWRKITYNYRLIGSVWVLFLRFAHTRPICSIHILQAAHIHAARITATITPI